MVHFGFEPGEEPTLNVVELVARGAEPFVNPGIVFLGREADGLPGLLNGEQPFAGAVPLLAGGERGCESSSSQAAQSSVLSSRFFSCSAFRASKYSWCSLLTREEAALKRSHKVSRTRGHGARLSPLVVELLQPAGSLDDRRFEQQRLGLLCKGRLSARSSSFEVKVTQLLVYLDETVEILDMEVVGLPQILDMGLRYDAGLFPAGLQVAEPGKGMVRRFLSEETSSLRLFDDCQLGAQVVLFLGFEVGDEFVAAGAVVLEKFLEARFESVDRGHETLPQARPIQRTRGGRLRPRRGESGRMRFSALRPRGGWPGRAARKAGGRRGPTAPPWSCLRKSRPQAALQLRSPRRSHPRFRARHRGRPARRPPPKKSTSGSSSVSSAAASAAPTLSALIRGRRARGACSPAESGLFGCRKRIGRRFSQFGHFGLRPGRRNVQRIFGRRPACSSGAWRRGFTVAISITFRSVPGR